MKKINEVTVFTMGDSNRVSTWSNVPYFFTKTLLSKGIKVNSADLSPNRLMQKAFNELVYPILKVMNRNTSVKLYRTGVYHFIIKHRIKKVIKRYPQADANIFMTYTISSAGFAKMPTVLFSDWPLEHYLDYFLRRKPDFLEKKCLERENSQIESSDLVISLFPGVVNFMQNRYENKNVYYIGNIINSMVQIKESETNYINKRSNKLLFIGNHKYIEGAQTLIRAFHNLKKKHFKISLHIIGLNKNDFDFLPENVFCHGYLDKGKELEKETYYKLLEEAKLCINTTPKWGGFSSIIEAMYFYVPVIVTPYLEFTTIFGNEINFGYFCEPNSPDLLEETISKIIDNPDYPSLCLNAHCAVKDFAWDNYIDHFLRLLEQRINSTDN